MRGISGLEFCLAHHIEKEKHALLFTSGQPVFEGETIDEREAWNFLSEPDYLAPVD